MRAVVADLDNFPLLALIKAWHWVGPVTTAVFLKCPPRAAAVCGTRVAVRRRDIEITLAIAREKGAEVAHPRRFALVRVVVRGVAYCE